MVSMNLMEILKDHVTDPLLGRVIGEGLKLIASSQIERMHCGSEPGQSAKYYADLHDFRKRIGYYEPGALIGLDETIDALRWCTSRIPSTNVIPAPVMPARA